MRPLTPAGENAVQSLAQRYGVSTDAVKTLLSAVSAGGGSMAQFYHPDLGGGGQWMRGGMTMVGDMFNSGLQSTVSGLCSELSTLLGNQQVFSPLPANSGNGFMGSGNDWWPSDLGSPSSSGGQNDARYAYFPQAQRLAISRNGQITVYNTLDHNIGGVQQQQGGYSGSLSFSSQFGTFGVESLPIVSSPGGAPASHVSQPVWAPPQQPAYVEPQYSQNNSQPQYAQSQSSQSQYSQNNQPQYSQNSQPQYSQNSQPQYSQNSSSGPRQTHDEILSALERLAALHQKGVLSDSEFASKKAELLSRL